MNKRTNCGYKVALSEELINEVLNKMAREPRNQVFSIELLNQKVQSKELILRPSYQREYVLSNSNASKFVESVFLGCVIPEIQLFEEADGVLEVLDGQQRSTALIKYLNDEYKLTGLKSLSMLNGYKFSELPLKLKNKYKNYLLSARTMKCTEDGNYKYITFERLNTGSKKLTQQEIRNCVYQGAMLNAAKEVSKLPIVIETVSYSKINPKRQDLVEFVIRLIAEMEMYPNLYHNACININYFLETYNKWKLEDINRVIDKFVDIITIMHDCVERNSLRTSKRNIITKTTIESVFIVIHCLLSEDNHITVQTFLDNKDDLNAIIRTTLKEGSEYNRLIGRTDSRSAILGRVNILKAAVLSVL